MTAVTHQLASAPVSDTGVLPAEDAGASQVGDAGVPPTGDAGVPPTDDAGVSQADDAGAVARLLGRPPAGSFAVVVRRVDGAPVVIENEPWLDDGTPMPTRYWLVDRAVRAAVSRLESGGGVRRAAAAVPADAVADAHARYASGRGDLADAVVQRAGRAPGPVPAGGVGGTRQGVKCLHAHVAWYLAGGDDPVGAWAAGEIDVDCSAFTGGRAAR